MDVTLVLTHRCNLSCDYCYAGEHFRKEMDDTTLAGAVDLLWSDGAETSQLGFFGGEPFLAFAAMQRATSLAVARAAEAPGRKLILQCTTNGTLIGKTQAEWIVQSGMRVTVSIDGVQEAHDMSRRLAGGGSSFEMVERGLRALLDARAEPQAMMVITPATAPFLFRSVRWLWSEGVRTVRANLDFAARWNLKERDVLREEMIAVGRELLWRRLRGEEVRFDPFEAGLASGIVPTPTACGEAGRARPQVVVATHGDLYPCAPMVGEDRADGPEAALRLGHLRDGAGAIAAAVAAQGAGCGVGGKACACSAYMETGDRDTAGPNSMWFGAVCFEVARAVGAALADAAKHPEPRRLEPETRRSALAMIVLGAGGLMLAGGVTFGVVSASRPHCSTTRTAGGMDPVRADEPHPMQPPPAILGSMAPQQPVAVPGGMRPAPPPPPPPPPKKQPPPEELMEKTMGLMIALPPDVIPGE